MLRRLRTHKGQCRPPPGMHKCHVTALQKRFMTTELSTVQNTADVSVFQDIMQEKCAKLGTRPVLGYALIHVFFNQEHLLKDFVHRGAFLFKKAWVDCKLITKIVPRARKKGLVTRSSNFYSTTPKQVLPKTGLLLPPNSVTNPAERDVLGPRLAGFDSLPLACCNLYDAEPSRALWKAMLQEWLMQVRVR